MPRSGSRFARPEALIRLSLHAGTQSPAMLVMALWCMDLLELIEGGTWKRSIAHFPSFSGESKIARSTTFGYILSVFRGLDWTNDSKMAEHCAEPVKRQRRSRGATWGSDASSGLEFAGNSGSGKRGGDIRFNCAIRVFEDWQLNWISRRSEGRRCRNPTRGVASGVSVTLHFPRTLAHRTRIPPRRSLHPRVHRRPSDPRSRGSRPDNLPLFPREEKLRIPRRLAFFLNVPPVSRGIDRADYPPHIRLLHRPRQALDS